MIFRRNRAYRLLFPEREVTKYFAKLLDVKLKKGVDFLVEGFDCRLRPVHIAIVLVYERDDSHDLNMRGFLLYRTPKGRLGSVPIVRKSQRPATAEERKAKHPDILGLIEDLQVDSVKMAVAAGAIVKIAWEHREHHVRQPDGSGRIVAWRPRLLF